MLSWASTVHELQVMSLDEDAISFNLQLQQFFNRVKMYVALKLNCHVVLFDSMKVI